MDGIGGLQGWRWIFILEGILTVVVAIFAYFLIYDFPETASFLTEREREFVIHRLKYQGSSPGAKKVAQHEGFDWKYVRDAFTDWQIYLSLFSKSSLQRRKVRLIVYQCIGVLLARFTAFLSFCQPLSRTLDTPPPSPNF